MSVFSMIKRGRQAARDHNAKQAEAKKKEEGKVQYKHVPTHAAIDAMGSGPASSRESDRARILEQNRRRSAMTASGMNMSGVMTPVHYGMPRLSTSLSYVSYPHSYATPPVPGLPRAHSYNSVNQAWGHHGVEINYATLEPSRMSLKGKEIERVAITEILNGSQTSSKGERGSPNTL
jgi:hypothetical protein